MASHKSKFSISKIIKVGTEYAMLNVSNQVINSIPNIPPAVKVLAGVATSFASFEILDSMVDTLPVQMRGIAKGAIEVQSALLLVQQLPNVLAAFSGGSPAITP